ncbi:cation:proton antiporter [Serpentinicella alkaliphila]|uniref:Sodium/proton antiporter (CPA1 family) n=1 Tax=Serpentinicella alkaliphila TaxID=1734049 RepID=A0A4R2TQD4_9FIRM|nr:cation:proton antiporter [Serpentinicella alkaliphila]QUH25502.1 cation:proton antiporter [Serpentinicella alkaliphila]TCP99688.1 sodium/proton antiporter (CPA1 family) [Serpentinicella alkaliphila]
MALSLAIIIILGLSVNKIFTKFKLPGLLGMIILGIILGPYGFNIISEDLLNISSDLRKIALIVILLRAGFGIKRDTLNRVGKTALKISFMPVVLEGFSIMVFGSYILGISYVEAGILGFIIAAVSPAVIVPQMLGLISRRKGEEKGIPTIILAGASVDDVVAITIFTALVGLYGTGQVNIFKQFVKIPISILMGIGLGVLVANLLIYLFKREGMRATKKTLVVLSVAIILTAMEDYLINIIPIASLLGVMTIGFIILEKAPYISEQLSSKFNKIWVFAEILLFVLVGAKVNIYVAVDAGLQGLIIIVIGLLARSLGVYISLLGTDLNLKEKLFCIIAYIPKATVQAAIGAVPLSAGIPSGEIILALAVLAIMITAPIGAIGIQISADKFLS